MKKVEISNLINGTYKESGKVISINNNFARVIGLTDCFMGEIVLFNNKIKGEIIELAEESLVLAFDNINIGDIVTGTGEFFTVKIGKNQKILNGLGEGAVLDGEYYRLNTHKKFTEIDNITEMIFTGTLSVDLINPIGKGQRVLIVGDNKTGKSTFCLNTILNNLKENKNFFIYVSISQSKNFNNRLIKFFENIKNSILIIAESSDNIAYKYYAPMVGMRISEYWRDLGFDVFYVIDDLTKHSICYRDMALLTKKNVGREAFPMDIFTKHANLLEKAGKKINSGSITCLAIASSPDLTEYIPTNLISITDGQIVFSNRINRLPMIDINLSVTRIGGLLPDFLKKLNYLSILKRYKNYERLKEIGGNLSKDLEDLVNKGIGLEQLFNQTKIYEEWEIYLLVNLFEKYNKNNIKKYEKFFKYFEKDFDLKYIDDYCRYINIMSEIYEK